MKKLIVDCRRREAGLHHYLLQRESAASAPLCSPWDELTGHVVKRAELCTEPRATVDVSFHPSRRFTTDGVSVKPADPVHINYKLLYTHEHILKCETGLLNSFIRPHVTHNSDILTSNVWPNTDHKAEISKEKRLHGVCIITQYVLSYLHSGSCCCFALQTVTSDKVMIQRVRKLFDEAWAGLHLISHRRPFGTDLGQTPTPLLWPIEQSVLAERP